MWQMRGGSLSLYSPHPTPAELFRNPEDWNSLYHEVRLKELLAWGAYNEGSVTNASKLARFSSKAS